MTRSYLTVDALSAGELTDVLDLADELKADRRPRTELTGRSVGMIFEKPSTRTRISFEVAITELGGSAVILNSSELQLGRGETVEDTAQVFSRYLSAVVVRTFAQERVETLASAGSIPVINALTDFSHPCQALADLQTIRERKGELAGHKLAYLGDGNNVAHSLLEAGALSGMSVTVACPPGHDPSPQVVSRAQQLATDSGAAIRVTADPLEAARDADVVYTDVWTSMGQEGKGQARLRRLQPYQVNADVMAAAKPDALAMHCLPAHRGEEITAEVMDGPSSVVFDQAENRLHSQKALLLFLLA